MRFAKNIIVKQLSSIDSGQIILVDNKATATFGKNTGLSATVTVNHPRFYHKLLYQGSLGAAKSYMDGDWSTDNLTALMRILIQNESVMNALDTPYSKAKRWIVDMMARLRHNNRSRAREYIHSHYDLGNTFFSTFLDESLMYSCAIFDHPNDNLHNAQLRKIEAICQQLQPKASDHILEIGTGWGSMAIHLAEKYGCQVTTTTISEQQYNAVSKRIAERGLDDKITLLNKDYRDLTGSFDKIVSIEMIEAVGYQYFDSYFKQCNNLLKPGGVMLLQAITMNDQSYDYAKEHVDFIRKYIFPGGCLPSVKAMGESIARNTKLQWLSLTDIGQNYV
ncbi:MAG: class I SAM-dependent methyltransferase, partial [Coxiellaceae bacterium]|nr:class I SAM-dependent methyltransferase [Coxiellaceae bacterium]